MMANNEEDVCNFEDFGLDDRILRAISKLGWRKPTLIQEKSISLALEGKDILARARTGSGKTGAYVIPIIQKILQSKKMAMEQNIKALIIAPTKELCSQAQRNILELTSSCTREIRSIDVSTQLSLDTQRPLLMERPDIVVGTPSRVLAHILAGNINVKKSLEMLAIDEADLLFSFGHEKDTKALIEHLPEIYQAFLMSATLSEDIKALKSMILHNPVILKLEQPTLPTENQLKQYKISSEEDEKFLVMYALIKLNLINGKIIIFVNTVDRCYKLKLFLEQFSISACILNSELPINSRCHIVSQFNEDRYDIIIAADESSLDSSSKAKQIKNLNMNNKLRKKDHESGVSRGIDFKHVTTIINFDFPPDVDSYVHRVGRTARADNRGMAISLVCIKELERLKEVEIYLSTTHPEGIQVFKFDMNEAAGLKYRADTARRSVTKDAIREARLKEIKTEIFNSQKLKAHFEDHPRDLQILKHDQVLHSVKIQPHLKNMPDYLIPDSLKNRFSLSKPRKRSHNASGFKKTYGKDNFSKAQIKHKKKQSDPLKSFTMEPLTKKRRK